MSKEHSIEDTRPKAIRLAEKINNHIQDNFTLYTVAYKRDPSNKTEIHISDKYERELLEGLDSKGAHPVSKQILLIPEKGAEFDIPYLVTLTKGEQPYSSYDHQGVVSILIEKAKILEDQKIEIIKEEFVVIKGEEKTGDLTFYF